MEPVQESVMALTDLCSQITGLNDSFISSDLQGQCELLVNSNGIYVPSVQVNFSSLVASGEQRLARVVELLGDAVFQSAAASSGRFEGFLEDLVRSHCLRSP